MAKADEDPEYQVFINYRSVDTRRYFASHLHNALQAKKMRPFMFEFVKDAGESAFSSWDAEEQNLLPVIRKALRDSKISVVIFSREYASSTYCLEELVIIQECRRKGQVVIPVFYDVSPAAVQKLAEGYGTWFARYEETMKESMDKVRQWKAALTEIAGLIGWSSSPYRNDAILIDEIVEDIHKKLTSFNAHIGDQPKAIAKNGGGSDNRTGQAASDSVQAESSIHPNSDDSKTQKPEDQPPHPQPQPHLEKIHTKRSSTKIDDHQKQVKQVISEGVFITTNLVLEISLIALEQRATPQNPHYSLVALLLSFMALCLCTIEIFFNFIKLGFRGGWYLNLQEKPSYIAINVFEMLTALFQCVFWILGYSYHRRHLENPLKVSLVSLIFIICWGFSRFTKSLKEASILPQRHRQHSSTV